jgi:hypothetical protein
MSYFPHGMPTTEAETINADLSSKASGWPPSRPVWSASKNELDLNRKGNAIIPRRRRALRTFVGRETTASLSQHIMSRRGLCLCCVTATTAAASGGWLAPRQAFAQARNIVDMIRNEAAKAPIKVHGLRRNVSILEGSVGILVS